MPTICLRGIMKNKSFIFIIVLVFMMALSLSAVSADDSPDAISGEVSGDVDITNVNPGNTSGELKYDIPADAKEIKSADLYVNVYSGSAQPTYGANANVTLKTVNGENLIASEVLWIEDGSTDGVVYPVNNHTNKCYSDYQMHYDITDSLKDLNGTAISIKVDTFKMENKSFDGRIKLISLILAYNDGDNDVINYWVDTTQRWTKTNTTSVFNTKGIKNIISAELINIALSSADGSYKVNGEFLGDAENHTSGTFYYQYNKWDVSDKIIEGNNTEILSMNTGTSTYGSLKDVITLLKVNSSPIEANVSFATEYTNTCFAGTNNTITIKANSNIAGKYVIELLADNVVVNSTSVDLDGKTETTVLLTDPTIRNLDESTVNGANNTKYVNYTVNVKYNNDTVGNASNSVPVLFNGNLGYDLEYGVKGFEKFETVDFTGDMVIDIKDVSSYLSANALNRTDVWNINLGNDSSLVRAFVFIPYNWFNGRTYTENESMFNVTFNGKDITPISYLRDQGNLGTYAKYGYGVFVYEVTDLITAGNNTLVLNKNYPTPAVYPSALVYMYDTEESTTLKHATIINGADLLSTSYNKAGRVIKSDSQISVDLTNINNATLYVFAASAQAGESNIIINGKKYVDVWNGTSSTTDLFTADITDCVAKNNNISFVSTGATILALSQIIVTAESNVVKDSEITIVSVDGTKITGILKDSDGNAISNATISYTIGNETANVTTDDKGEFVIPAEIGKEILIKYAGSEYINPTNTTFIIKDRIETVFESEAYKTIAIDFYAGERGNYFNFTLKDVDGNPLANKTVFIGFNGVTYNKTTDENGTAFLQINLMNAGTYTFAMGFLGDEKYVGAFMVQKITVTQKKTSISAAAKTYKASTKTKKYTVTLKTNKGNSIDGKTYLRPGKTIKLTVNGKTYAAKTNDKGQATFKITKLTKKGTYTAKIKFAGDKTYKASSNSVKIKVK